MQKELIIDAAHLATEIGRPRPFRVFIMVLQLICWLTIVVFIAAAVAEWLYTWRIYPNAWCGNAIIDPMSILLGIFAPVTAIAVIGLDILWYQWGIRSWNPIVAGLATTITLVSSLAYNYWLYQITIGDSEGFVRMIWWLWPLRLVS